MHMLDQNEVKNQRTFPVHQRYFILTVGLFLFGIFAEWEVRKNLEDFFWVWILFLLPSFIHFLTWVSLLRYIKRGESVFCDFFDRTMCLSIASFSIPHYFYSILRAKWDGEGYWFLIGFGLTILLLFLLCLMVFCVNYELVKVDSNEIDKIPDSIVTQSNSQQKTENKNDSSKHGSNEFLKKILGLSHKLYATRQLKSGIIYFPFWRVLHFFAIFMSITYVFGFLIAFYDFGTIKGYIGSERGFYFEKINVKPTNPVLKGTSETDVPGIKNSPKPIETPKGKPSPIDSDTAKLQITEELPLACFYFSSGKATLSETEVINTLESDTSIDENYNNNKILQENKNTLGKVLDALKPTRDDDRSKENPTYKIYLHGYADNENVTGNSYKSNFELTLARITNVQGEISKKLKIVEDSSRIEWLLFPHSNEEFANGCQRNANSQPKIDDIKDEPVSSRAVAVFIKEESDDHLTEIKKIGKDVNIVKNDIGKIDDKVGEINNTLNSKIKPTPNLTPQQVSASQSVKVEETFVASRETTALDYLYLSIGAITTNAAGDVKPVTPTARFLISLISLFQIFFLVGFFNTLISLQENKIASMEVIDSSKEKNAEQSNVADNTNQEVTEENVEDKNENESS